MKHFFFWQGVIANINGDHKNAHINIKYDVSGFPTLRFFSKSNKKPEDYNGERNEEEIVAYLNKKCGTSRAVGGSLNDQVCKSNIPNMWYG